MRFVRPPLPGLPKASFLLVSLLLSAPLAAWGGAKEDVDDLVCKAATTKAYSDAIFLRDYAKSLSPGPTSWVSKRVEQVEQVERALQRAISPAVKRRLEASSRSETDYLEVLQPLVSRVFATLRKPGVTQTYWNLKEQALKIDLKGPENSSFTVTFRIHRDKRPGRPDDVWIDGAIKLSEELAPREYGLETLAGQVNVERAFPIVYPESGSYASSPRQELTVHTLDPGSKRPDGTARLHLPYTLEKGLVKPYLTGGGHGVIDLNLDAKSKAACKPNEIERFNAVAQRGHFSTPNGALSIVTVRIKSSPDAPVLEPGGDRPSSRASETRAARRAPVVRPAH